MKEVRLIGLKSFTLPKRSLLALGLYTTLTSCQKLGTKSMASQAESFLHLRFCLIYPISFMWDLVF